MESNEKCNLICEFCRHKSKDCKEKIFPCAYSKTRSEQMMDEMGVSAAASISEKLEKKLSVFSKILVHEHGDPTKPPEWLDTDKNTCLYFIRDEFDIVRKFNAIDKKHFDQSDVWWN